MPEANGTSSRWQTYAMGAGLVFTIVGSLVAFLIQTAATNYTVAQNVLEIGKLDRAVAVLSERNASLTITIAQMQRDTLEVEEQLCRISDVVAVNHANELRLAAVFFRQIFGTEYPIGNATYPRVGKCGDAK